MVFVVSDGSVKSLQKPTPTPGSSIRLGDDYTADYAAIWRAQPAVRTCVTFLARNISDLGLHVYERTSDTDRRRMADHPLAALIRKPNPFTTHYRLINALVHDRGIYDRAYWLKLRGTGLVRIPPAYITAVGDNWITPDAFQIRGSRGKLTVPADRLVYFRGFDPLGDNGTSPIEGLRRILAEDYEAGRMREQQLRNGARMTGYITRPKDAGSWSPEARDRFSRGWRNQFTGGGSQAGGTPILEDGMQFVPASQTSEQLEYVAARKLTREETASSYFIPPPMVGILDHATFGNIEEQHKMLYMDTLGPWLTEITEEIELQLLPYLDARTTVYVEFNLREKLKGSFKEESASLMTATGAPYLTRNEARARQNLPALPDGDELVIPLNVLVGGQTTPGADPDDPAGTDVETAPKSAVLAELARAGVYDGLGVAVKSRAPSTHEAKAAEVLVRFFARQKRVVLTALGAKAADAWWDEDRWNGELTDDLLALALLTSGEVGAKVAEGLGFDAGDYDVDRTTKFLRAVASSRASMINAATKRRIDDVLAAADEDVPPSKVFDDAETVRAPEAAIALVTTWSAFATTEAGKQVAGDRAVKTWIVSSSNPRPEHASMDGETVAIDATFSNGANWPGDPVLGADGVAGCQCGVEVSIP